MQRISTLQKNQTPYPKPAYTNPRLSTITPRTSHSIINHSPRRPTINTTSTIDSTINTTSTIDSTIETVDQLIETPTSTQSTPFSFTKQWYPIGFVKFMDPKKPHPVQLLGNNLVVWKDTVNDTWHCFEDRCPHRAAPFSEGKIMPHGTIQCSYHGWQFSNDGTAVRIPQAASEEAEERACTQSKRACAVAYPLIEAQGMLFIWGEPLTPESEKESAEHPPPIDRLLAEAQERGDKITYIIPQYVRDVPYDFSTLVENVVDTAHVPFAHHNVQGNRDKVKYGDYEFKLIPSSTPSANGSSNENTVRAEYKSIFGQNGTINFEAPGVVNLLTGPSKDGIYSSFRIYATPISPGKARLLSFLSTNRPNIPSIFKIIGKMPPWLDHIIYRHPVLDGDNVLLHQQEQFMVKQARENNKSWRDFYYMPTRADLVVAGFRKWLDTVGKGGPYGPLHTAKNYPPLITNKRMLLNRYEEHTKHCSSCTNALKWIERWLFVVAAVACLGFAVMATEGVKYFVGGKMAIVAKSAAGGGLVGTMGALVFYWLWKLRGMFYFVDYVHAER